MKVIAIIPARFKSTRLPGKVLSLINGKSILYLVYQQAVKAKVFDGIFVATDDKRIYDHCLQLNMNVFMTSENHISGTDRIAEVAEKQNADIVINIQGDEPFIEIECIRALVNLMKQKHVKIGTLFKKIEDENILFDYNTVKLVKDKGNRILFFSRQAIPAQRDLPFKKWMSSSDYFQHLGVYGFHKKTLMDLVNLVPSELELSEKLEQLRWLENGYEIYGAQVDSVSFGIDTEEDLKKAMEIYR